MLNRLARMFVLAGIAALAACDGSPTGGGSSARISISPAVDTLDAVGDTRTLTAQITGTTAQPTWESLTSGIVQVTSAGRVTAMAPGAGTVRASVAGVSATAAVTVRPPGEVTVTSGSVRFVHFTTDEVTLTLNNSGGRAVYRVEFWGLRNSPTGAHFNYGMSEPVEVAPNYNQTVKFTVQVRSSPGVHWVIVNTRDPGSATYRRTHCHRFLSGGTQCPVP